jgi:uncharacterized protein YndB with AHSA1/START domain
MADLEGTRSIEIAAPRERCFAIAADLDHLPEWHGAMTEVKVLERDSDGRGTPPTSSRSASGGVSPSSCGQSAAPSATGSRTS